MIPDKVTSTLAEELTDAVQWLQRNGRPELTVQLALTEAIEDWIALARTEHLRGDEIPRPDDQPRQPPHPCC